MNDFAEKCSLPMNTFLVERLENYPSMAMDDATAIAIIAVAALPRIIVCCGTSIVAHFARKVRATNT